MRRRGSPGFTLTEVLVTLFVAVVVVGVLYLLYNTLYRVTGEQAKIKGTEDAVVLALQTLSQDLISSQLLAFEERCDISLVTVDPYAELSFCTTVPGTQDDAFAWYDVQRVAYKVIPLSEGMPTLVRTVQPLTGPEASGSVVTNALVKNVRTFHVESFDGEAWHMAWGHPDQKGLPRSARLSITLLTDKDRVQRTEVFIPGGNPVKSSLNRGGGAPVEPAP